MYLNAALHCRSTEGLAVQGNICQKEYYQYQHFNTELCGAKCPSTNGYADFRVKIFFKMF